MNRRELLLGSCAAAISAALPPAKETVWYTASRESAATTVHYAGLTTEQQRLLWERLGKYLQQDGVLDKLDMLWLFDKNSDVPTWDEGKQEPLNLVPIMKEYRDET